jgi:hypothetical protein
MCVGHQYPQESTNNVNKTWYIVVCDVLPNSIDAV